MDEYASWKNSVSIKVWQEKTLIIINYILGMQVAALSISTRVNSDKLP